MSELESHLQQIWDNWRSGEGKCQGCDARDCNGGWAPYYGAGDPNADLILLGRDPGGNEDRFGRFDQRDSENRNYPTSKWSERTQDYAEKRPKDVDIIRSAPEGSTFLEELDCYQRSPSGESKGVYFTNLKKCQEIAGYDETDAYNRCASYLPKEFELVNPSVVVCFKPEPLKWALDYYNIGDRDLGSPTEMALVNSWTTDDVTILPSVHFSMLNSYVHYTVAEDSEDYWKQLAAKVNQAI